MYGERGKKFNDVGVLLKETSVVMVFALHEKSDVMPGNGIDIRSVDTNLNDWMAPLVEAFESTITTAQEYVEIHAMALLKRARFYHFSLYDENRPVASITLSVCENTARLDDVGTLPAYQKKGYATHLVQHTLSVARKLGAQHCFLEASDSGLSVYEKIGFQPLFKNKIYSYVPAA